MESGQAGSAAPLDLTPIVAAEFLYNRATQNHIKVVANKGGRLHDDSLGEKR